MKLAGPPELKDLAQRFNQLTTTVATLQSAQAEALKQAQFYSNLTHTASQGDRKMVYNLALQKIRELLAADRTIIYLFDEQWQGTVVAESVAKEYPTALGTNITDPCFVNSYVEKYRRGRVQALANIYEANLDLCYIGQLEPFEVKANIVAPILLHQRLLGLLCVHQCSGPRAWQEAEVNFLRQAAIELSFALEQVDLFEQKEQARLQAERLSQEQVQKTRLLQEQLVELLSSVEGAARGDLTVRADVTAGEIGTVADFFNSIVESLRQIVTQVKESALEVNLALGKNEQAMRQLAEDAQKQAEETNLTLQTVEEMKFSIQQVAESASQAAEVAQTASEMAQEGGVAMDLTVQNILKLRETIGETAKKVKRLGESSQEISKVVSLINQIATQTNLLAINAGIEAARAGEDGQGFAVVAEEVGALAARSAAATQEIEQIVQTIQRETSEVVEAMEQGTTQVVEGTYLVKNTRQSLEQIVDVSQQIDQLLQSISKATVSQVQTSQAIALLMQDVAQVAGQTSGSSRQVSTSLRQTVDIARSLQESVEMFKVI
ncbi:GAF domain-containing protein [Leptodesmis sichuanensis A121]|nr:GAF domain-containing protein [Leptodesmis sichuanensis A121]